jgi:hypothetical protein
LVLNFCSTDVCTPSFCMPCICSPTMRLVALKQTMGLALMASSFFCMARSATGSKFTSTVLRMSTLSLSCSAQPVPS